MSHLAVKTQIYSIHDLQRHYEQKTGGHWFEKSTMAFFKSRVSEDLVYGFDTFTGHDFILFFSSELGPNQPKRRYSIRHYDVATGTISTVGIGFQGYKTLAAAKLAASKLPKVIK